MEVNLNNDLLIIEKDLNEQIGALRFHWFGRAATALYTAFKAIINTYSHIEYPEIILPALSCATPANVALMAGFKVRFADVSLVNGLVTLENIKKRVNSNTVAILYIHLYGNTGNVKEIKDWCTVNNLALIEDLAQALGAVFDESNQMAGCYGDFSVFSFNQTKIIEDGGGLLTLNNIKYENSLKKIIEGLNYDKFKLKSESALALSYRNLHHSLVTLLRNASVLETKEISQSFIQIRHQYEGLYIKKFKYNSSLVDSWKRLKINVNERYEKAKLYKKSLNDNSEITLLSQFENSKMCWRFSFLLNPKYDISIFSELIRKDGFHVSNLYWPVNDFFYPEDLSPNAKFISLHIINLWVNSSVDENYIINCSNSILKNINQYN